MEAGPAAATPPGKSVVLLPAGPVPLATETAAVSLGREAMQWSYIVRNRMRWADRGPLADEQAARARALLEALGVSTNQLGAIARAQVTQVSIPYRAEEEDWALRILPWEFILTAATRPLRVGQPLTVLRQLRRAGAPRAPVWKAPRSVLHVESAPGSIAGLFTFDSEQALVRSNLAGLTWHEIKNPTRNRLASKVQETRPDVIHLAGFDTHQGLGLAAGARSVPGGDLDGYLLRGETTELDAVDAATLATILTASGHRPLLVGCSFWNSASRIAPLLVAAGVQAVIGFQDSFDDDLVELFFAGLYRRWRHAAGNLTDAFVDAWALMRARPTGLLGTGIVLWHEAPLVGPGVVEAGDLVLIEATQLTESRGFWEAVEAGAENLRPRREFQLMLDIISARTAGVTPLPIVEATG